MYVYIFIHKHLNLTNESLKQCRYLKKGAAAENHYLRVHTISNLL